MNASQMTRRLSIVAAALTGFALLTGCSAGTSDAGGYLSGVGAVGQSAYSEAQMDMAAMESPTAMGGTELDAGSKSTVITSGSATILVSDPVEASTEFTKKIEALGGRIDNTWQSEWDGTQSSSVTVAVPADKYTEAVDLLSDFGRVLDSNSSREDVGIQIADLDARKAALETSITRLEELLEAAKTTEELLQAEQMLTERQANLDALNSQLDWLNRQIDMSSLSVTFTESVADAPGFSWERAWQMLGDSFRVVAYALVIIVPWLLIAAVVVAAVLLIVRSANRRRNALPGTPSSAKENHSVPVESPADTKEPEGDKEATS